MNLAAILAFFIVSFTVAAAVVVAALIWTGRKRAAEANQDEPSALAILKSEELSSIGAWHDLLGTRLEQADLNWSVGRVTMAMLLLATIAFSVVWQISILPIWLALILVPLAGMAPYLVIASKRKRRFHKFKELFPDALETLGRALRSGATAAGGLDVVATECDAPVSTEIRKTFVEVNLGMSWDRALENLAKRVPLQEVSLFVAAVQIHSRTGGKLGEVMGRLAETMREQNSLQGEVRAIAAHGKMTGMVLTVLPLGIAFLMMMVSPDYISMLFTHPWGKHMIAGAAVCLVLAHVIISRIVDIEA